MSCTSPVGSNVRLPAFIHILLLWLLNCADATQGALRETLRIGSGLSSRAGVKLSFLTAAAAAAEPDEPANDATSAGAAQASTTVSAEVATTTAAKVASAAVSTSARPAAAEVATEVPLEGVVKATTLAPAREASGASTTPLAAPANLLVPLANDTLSAAYWNQVNQAIAAAARLTTPPPSFNDPPPTAEPDPWDKVFQASSVVTVVDSPQRAENLNNWELATPMPPRAEVTATGALVSGSRAQTHSMPDKRFVSVVPYDMQLGARIMSGLTEKAPGTPPPSQAIVDETFVSQCPILMFGNSLSVRAPRCGSTMGEWADPTTNRAVLRWDSNKKGGLRFGVDSAVTGPGSVLFADLVESLSIDRSVFNLYNCLNVKRYIIEESIIKVDHMAANAYTTMLDHDLGGTKEAFFYEYTIKHLNGSAVAKTTLFRLDQDMVNFTWFSNLESPVGKLIAVASRSGHWKRDQWRTCTENPRGWQLNFTDAALFDTAASVMDLRLASAVVINLMAYRDEEVSADDGFQHIGQGELYWSFLSWFFSVFLVAVACLALLLVCWIKEIDKKLKRFCFRLEQVLLPKRPISVRTPILNPTY